MSDEFSETPEWTWRASITTEDGQVHDITRELAVMYDAIVGSMDWGSGFLDIEDVNALFRVASLCDFDAGDYEVKTEHAATLVDENGAELSGMHYERGNAYAVKKLTKDGLVWEIRDYKPIASGTAVAVRRHQRTIGGVDDRELCKIPPTPVVAGQKFSITVPAR